MARSSRPARSAVLGLLAALLLTSGPAACATMAGDGMQEKLYEATRSYNRSLRWSDFDRAAAWVPAESEFAFMNMHEDAVGAMFSRVIW